MATWTECPECERRFKTTVCPKCGWAPPRQLAAPRWLPPPLSPMSPEDMAHASQLVQAVLAGTLTAPQAQALYDAMGWPHLDAL